MKKIIITAAVLLTLNISSVFAVDPPSAGDVANTVSNFWIKSQMDSMGSYITNLYSSYSNYVPAVLAKSFHDEIYLGNLEDATGRLNRVKNFMESSGQGSEVFNDMLDTCITFITEELETHRAAGRTLSDLQSNASPSTVRSACNNSFLPSEIHLLFEAPSITITNTP